LVAAKGRFFLKYQLEKMTIEELTIMTDEEDFDENFDEDLDENSNDEKLEEDDEEEIE